jgi:hypothetical protein
VILEQVVNLGKPPIQEQLDVLEILGLLELLE